MYPDFTPIDEGIVLNRIHYYCVLVVYLWCILFTISLLLTIYFRYIKRKENPFLIVLVDIKHAAYHQEILCIETPLHQKTNRTKYVALSYRWGEYQEQLVDTEIGYVAGIRGFHLDDFYMLCRMMAKEPDLQHIHYVWVDAICIDQNNHARRKKMVHEMSNIYKNATYIVGVPDLYATYLKTANHSNLNMMKLIKNHRVYLYYAMTVNCIELDLFQKRWLEENGVPNDIALRSAIIGDKTTLEYMDGLMTILVSHDYPAHKQLKDAVAYIEEGSSLASTDNWNEIFATLKTNHEPLVQFLWAFKKHLWARKWMKLEDETEQAVNFLADIVKEWAARVWVISEYTIAKSKGHQKSGSYFKSTQDYSNTSKMKIWFIQLSCPALEGKQFLEFFFDADPLTSLGRYDETHHKNIPVSTSDPRTQYYTRLSYGVPTPIGRYNNMSSAMGNSLQEPEFLQMVLGSKASKDVDRLHAILPLSPYKHFVEDKNTIDRWNITSTMGLKLKLYEIMSVNHKAELLLSSCSEYRSQLVAPTFATAEFIWMQKFGGKRNFGDPININTEKLDGIKLLIPMNTEVTNFLSEWWPFSSSSSFSSCGQDYEGFLLTLTPKTYHVYDIHNYPLFDEESVVEKHSKLLNHLKIPINQLTFVSIPVYEIATIEFLRTPDIQLMGHVESNRWVLARFLLCRSMRDVEFSLRNNDKTDDQIHRFNSTGSDIDETYTFNIY